jgi:hypothetical protein
MAAVTGVEVTSIVVSGPLRALDSHDSCHCESRWPVRGEASPDITTAKRCGIDRCSAEVAKRE